MNERFYTDESRKRWFTREVPSHEQLRLGCLQRIAAATEAMATSYRALIDERDYLKRRLQDEERANASLRRRNAALRGAITRLKRQEGKR